VWSIGRWYDFEEPERTLVWTPYARRIAEAIEQIHEVQPDYEVPRIQLSPRELADEVLRTTTVRPARKAIARARQILSTVRAARA
jgi:hypothetical protein